MREPQRKVKFTPALVTRKHLPPLSALRAQKPEGEVSRKGHLERLSDGGRGGTSPAG